MNGFNWSLLILLPLALSACAHGGAKSSTREIVGDGYELTLRTEAESVPGTFFLGLVNGQTLTQLPITSHLLALGSDGRIEFQRSFVDEIDHRVPVNFRALSRGGYAYFLGLLQGLYLESTFHLLDAKFRDWYPQTFPNRDRELDGHEFVEVGDGNFYFVFARKRLGELALEAEIQRWDSKGRITFVWSTRDRKKISPAEVSKVGADILAINSLHLLESGNLLVGFRELNEIAEIEVPSGKILWILNKGTWKFVDDPFGGFAFQHCVRRLPNGNIILFDNGDGKRPARAVEYRLDAPNRTATMVWEHRFTHVVPEGWIGGSVQRLSNGNTLIGWGGPIDRTNQMKPRPLFTEVGSSGNVVRELSSKAPLVSYEVSFKESKP